MNNLFRLKLNKTSSKYIMVKVMLRKNSEMKIENSNF